MSAREMPHLTDENATHVERLVKSALCDGKWDNMLDDMFRGSPECVDNCVQLLIKTRILECMLFGFQSLTCLFGKYGAQWNAERYRQLLGWMTAWILERSSAGVFHQDKSVQTGKLILREVGSVYGCVVVSGWVSFPDVQNFFVNIVQSFPDNTVGRYHVLEIVSGVITRVKKMDLKQVIRTRFNDTILVDMFNYAAGSLGSGPVVDGFDMSSALEIMSECLDFCKRVEDKCAFDEIVAEICRPHVSFRDHLTKEGLYRLLFMFVMNVSQKEKMSPEEVRFAGLSLDVIYHLCSIDGTFYGSREKRDHVWELLCGGMAAVLPRKVLTADDGLLLRLSKILYKLRLSFRSSQSGPSEAYLRLLATVKDVTVGELTVQNNDCKLITHHQAVIYLIRFWTICAARDASEDFRSHLSGLFALFVNGLKNMVDYDPDAVSAILDLSKGRLCDAACSLPRLMKDTVMEIATDLIEELARLREMFIEQLHMENNDKQLQVIDLKVTIVIQLIVGILTDRQSRKTMQDFEVKYFGALREFLTRTEDHIGLMVRRKCVHNEVVALMFLRAIPKFVGTPEDFNKGIGEYGEVFDWVNNRAMASLGQMGVVTDDGELNAMLRTALRIGVEAFQRGISTCFLRRKDLDMSSFDVILSNYHKLPFLAHPLFGRECKMFMKALGCLFVDMRPSDIKGRFRAEFASIKTTADPARMFVFVMQLTGILASPQCFPMIFDWIFPDMLKDMHVLLDNIRDPRVLKALLQLWRRILYRGPGDDVVGVSFPPHSENGIVLFKMVASLLVKAFTVIDGMREADGSLNESGMGLLKRALFVFTAVMDTNYIMYGAFALYGDRQLVELMGAFIGIMKMVDTVGVSTLLSHGKVGHALMGASMALMSRHAKTVLDMNQTEFFVWEIKLIKDGYGHIDDRIVDKAIAASKSLGRFLCENKDLKILRAFRDGNAQLFIDLLFTAWGHHLNANDRLYDIRLFLISGLMFMSDPRIINELLRRVQAQLRDIQEDLLATVAEEVGKLGESDDTTHTNFHECMKNLWKQAGGRGVTVVD